jgi:peroxiredoxin
MPASKMPTHSVDVLRLKSTLVYDETGKEFLLGDAWNRPKTVVIVFVRHFGCIACRAHVTKVMNHKAQLENDDCELIFIGHGTPEALADFKNEFNLYDVRIYTDPRRETFKACSFKKGFLNLVNPTSARNMAELRKQGFSQGNRQSNQGIHRQMGGVVVISQPEKVTYHYISEAVGDFPEDEKVLENVARDVERRHRNELQRAGKTIKRS